MAKRFFGDRDPIGARIAAGTSQNWTTIVGVVGDTRQTLDSAPSDGVYVPLGQSSPLTAMFLLRTVGAPGPDLPRLAREAVYSIDPNQPEVLLYEPLTERLFDVDDHY